MTNTPNNPLATDVSLLRKVTFRLAVFFFVTWLGNLIATRFIPSILFAGESALFLWAFIATLIHYLFFRLGAWNAQKGNSGSSQDQSDQSNTPGSLLPAFARYWQWAIVIVTVILLASLIASLSLWRSLLEQDPTLLRFGTVGFLGVGILLYFLIRYISTIQSQMGFHRLDTLLTLASIVFWASIAGAAVLFIAVSFERDLSGWLGWPLLFLAVFLALESLLLRGLSFYQPHLLRSVFRPAGDSLLLDLLFGQGSHLKESLRHFESVVGRQLKDVWVLKFFQQTGLGILCSTLLLGWFSTSLTMVPPSYHGVLIHFGRFESQPLAPGLHLTLPWPLDQVVLVNTEKIHQIALGFDKDLKRAVLWNEPHVEGEKNLLTGDGEALLTITVPILYKISNPVAYLTSISDPKSVLQDLAERRLLHVISSHDSFEIMIFDRAGLAHRLQLALQKELDSLGAGIDVIFVGLQDAHPPVEVAPAFQKVISAEEEKEATIDQAQADRASTLPQAQSQAFTLESQATSQAIATMSKAESSTNRFLQLAQVDHTYSDLFRTQMRLSALQSSLPSPYKVIIGIPAQRTQQFYLDLRNTSEIPPP